MPRTASAFPLLPPGILVFATLHSRRWPVNPQYMSIGASYPAVPASNFAWAWSLSQYHSIR